MFERRKIYSDQKMKNLWVVIHGRTAPESEIFDAQRVVDKLTAEGKTVYLVPDNKLILHAVNHISNFVVVGGPVANKWARIVNSRVNPKGVWFYDETGTLVLEGYELVAIDGTVTPYNPLNNGIIGKGKKLRPSLEVIALWGSHENDTHNIIERFLEDAPAGVYTTP